MRMAVFEHVRERREVHDPEAADNRWLREAFENQIRLHVSDRLLGQNDGPMLEAVLCQNSAFFEIGHKSAT